MSNQNPNPCCKCTDPQYYLTLNAQGPQGRQGKDGVDGFSPTINVVTNTPSQYVLSITDINGTKQTPNLKASLPQGGTTGMVLTRYGNEDGEFNWQNLPTATTLNYGITRLATTEDFSPTNEEEPYEYPEDCTLSPQSLVSFLGNIPTSMDSLFNGAGKICQADRASGFLNIPGVNAGTRIESPSYYLLFPNSMRAEVMYPTSNNELMFGTILYPTKINGSEVYINGAEAITTDNIATTSTAGIVKPDGTTITVDEDGTLHGASTYNLPTASATVLGGIKVGENLTITEDGTLSATGGGSTNLNNITDTDSGVAITDADSGLTYPQTINIATRTEDERYSYIECKSSESSLSSGLKFDLDNLTLMGGSLNNTASNSGGIKLSFDALGSNPSMIISEPVFLKGRKDVDNVVSNLLAFDYTHTTGTSDSFTSNGFFIFNKRNSYSGSFTTNGILFTVGDEPSIKFTTSTSDNGIWTDNVNATVLTDKTGIQYKALTSTEYTELQTKSDSTIYRLTDTNKVYLGTIELTGGGASAKQSTFVNYPESSIVKMNALKSETQVASGYPDAMKIVIGDSSSTSYNIYFSYPGSSLPNADGTGYAQSSSYQYNLNLTSGTSTGTTITSALLYYYNKQVYYTDSLDNLKSYVSGFDASKAIYVGSGSVVSGRLQQLTSVPEYVINNFTGG